MEEHIDDGGTEELLARLSHHVASQLDSRPPPDPHGELLRTLYVVTRRASVWTLKHSGELSLSCVLCGLCVAHQSAALQSEEPS
jgi:hypothetical protein